MKNIQLTVTVFLNALAASVMMFVCYSTAFNTMWVRRGVGYRLRHSSGPQSGRNSWCSSSHSERPRKSAETTAEDVPPNRHIAKSHDDTTEGAVHCFQDEFGVHISVFFVRMRLIYLENHRV